jgi:hypothetical protein
MRADFVNQIRSENIGSGALLKSVVVPILENQAE